MHDDLELPPQLVRTPKIIAGAITGGLLAITVFCAIAYTAPEDAVPGTPIVTFTLVPFSIILFLIARPIVTATLSSSAIRTSDGSASQLLGVYQTMTIVDFAMLEGAGVCCATAYLVEGQIGVLAIPGLMLIMMILKFPSSDKIQQWIRDKQDFSQFQGPPA